MPSLGANDIGAYEQIAPKIFIKKVSSAGSVTDRTLYTKTYYDEGIKFVETRFIGQAPNSGGGTLVRNQTEYQQFGSTQVAIRTETYAHLKSGSYTTYGTERFTLPGVLK